MKRIPYIFIILSLMFSSLSSSFSVANAAAEIPENNTGAVLCSPAVYLQTPDDCVPLGPSQYMTDMARLGMQVPLQQLDISHPDPALGELPYKYYRINKTGTKFYQSVEAAQSGSGGVQGLPPTTGLLYVVYTQRLDEHNFLLPSGVIMPGDGYTISPDFTTPNKFPGVEVHSIPKNPFGFVWNPTSVRPEPNEMDYNTPIRKLNSYDIIQIYASENVEGTLWYLTGPDEWVLARNVAVVTPNTTPPDGVTNGRWIDVNLQEQTLAVYDQSQMVYATIIATGEGPLFTRPGLFPIYKKMELELMEGMRGTSEFYHLENVPWTMYFDKARALHGAYWRTTLGFPQSHGCVNLFPGDAHWLFDWAREGDWVYVHDPSGLTPSDPAFYGDGGA
jgi:hypothetical protein